jgi:hypothetical protein
VLPHFNLCSFSLLSERFGEHKESFLDMTLEKRKKATRQNCHKPGCAAKAVDSALLPAPRSQSRSTWPTSTLPATFQHVFWKVTAPAARSAPLSAGHCD